MLQPTLRPSFIKLAQLWQKMMEPRKKKRKRKMLQNLVSNWHI